MKPQELWLVLGGSQESRFAVLASLGKEPDSDSLYISDFKLVCLERWFARLRCSSQNVRGPADWPAPGFPTSTCTCVSVSTGKVSGSEMERKEQKMSFSCNVLSSNFALHKYVSSSLDSPGI